MDILNVLQGTYDDQTITSYQYHTYKSFNPSLLAKNDEIRIPISSSDAFLHVSEGLILVEGEFTATKETAVTTSIYPAFLFSEIKLESSGKLIDSTRNLGLVTCIKAYLSTSYAETASLTQFSWHQTDHAIGKQKKFQFYIPLKRLLGFAEDYKKISIFQNFTIVLLRSRSDNNCFSSIETGDEVSIDLKTVEVHIPHVTVKPEIRLRLLKIVESARRIKMHFRTWKMFEYPKIPITTHFIWQVMTTPAENKPQYVILVFSQDREDKKDKNFAFFDNMNVRNAKIFLNSTIIPYEEMNLNYENNKCAPAYREFLNFKKFYYGLNESNNSIISAEKFQKHVPMLIFNTMFTEQPLKSTNSIDIRIEVQFNENVTTQPTAYCLILAEDSATYDPFTGLVEK